MKLSIYNISLTLFIIIMVVYGMYFISKPRNESFVNEECPNTMIKDGNKILVYNPKFPKISGVNPIELNSLEDYEEYVQWQRENKMNCPILHLEKVFDTQGNEMYQNVSDFSGDNSSGGLNHSLPDVKQTPDLGKIIDASLDNSPYNSNQFPGYDPLDQDVGRPNVIDGYTFNYYTTNPISSQTNPKN